MYREDLSGHLGALIKDCPPKSRHALEKMGKAIMEYTDYEMGFFAKDINQRIKVLENKVEMFYKPNECPKCGSNRLLRVISPKADRGKMYCKDCGLIA